MESYSQWIRSGYNVIIVSHSQGNFYANQVMRKLGDYGERDFGRSNHYSAFYSTERNPFFPKILDLVANVQVATPVSETIANSPWTTFKDDLIINLVRSSLGALPANIGSPGAGLPPHGDLLGHSFEKAYLRNPESRAKIIAEIEAAQSRLRFSIAFAQEAVLITHPSLLEVATKPMGARHLYFKIIDPDGREYHGYDEADVSETQSTDMHFVDCLDLKVGKSSITAETIVEGVSQASFTYTAWPEGRANPSQEKLTRINFTAPRGTRRWDIGVIRMSPGKDKEPLKVSVELYPQPSLR
jgi:hypothetical protein